jgi:FKBP-type peptidyl-prolyl cis-trans isomerase
MSKKKTVERKKKEEEKDLEEEELDEGEEEEEEEASVAPAKRSRPRAKAAAHDHGHDEEADEDDEGEEDPYWWTPHAVLSGLVLVGVLGFFGVFNKALGGIAAKPAASAEQTTAAHSEPAAKTPAAQDPHAQRPQRPHPPRQMHPPPPVPEDVKAPPANATKTASGLAYRVIKKGSGAQQPKATDAVTVNYTGWTTDGKMFDSSITRGQPATFRLNQVIKGWTEGVQLMHVGETTRFWIPGALAYGDKPMRPGAPAGMLVFDVELIAIK